MSENKIPSGLPFDSASWCFACYIVYHFTTLKYEKQRAQGSVCNKPTFRLPRIIFIKTGLQSIATDAKFKVV